MLSRKIASTQLRHGCDADGLFALFLFVMSLFTFGLRCSRTLNVRIVRLKRIAMRGTCCEWTGFVSILSLSAR